ncbi:acyl carrier protein [Yinghuangia sp. ASG 101]|uniref:acyl carrier protein n=1 Tax=Yinghuangia sp. ASG 101 TaxID=2896848 RepID=UPI001E618EF4|nr:acyl carrier protein [Yinghuangia sp. ASG 101]UGQ09784.1 acyl carrier protein [Yinghuangia sp. ASG 101]
MSTKERLKRVFAQALDLEPGTRIEELRYRDIDKWDSLGHMALVAAIEDEFAVQFDTDQVIDMSAFKVAYDMLREMGLGD